MAQASRKDKTKTGVSLEVEVMSFLDSVANTDERDRSFVINRIVREWAEAKGTPIPVKRKEERRGRTV